MNILYELFILVRRTLKSCL